MEEKQERKLMLKKIKPTNDYVFKRIFGRKGNEDLTKNLLSNIIPDKIEKINVDENPILDKDIISEKGCILDLTATLNDDVKVDVEMQVLNIKGIEKRLLYYWGKLYTKGLEVGDRYNEAKRTIVIMITPNRIPNFDDIPKFHTRWNIREEEFYTKVLTSDFEIDIIELPKVKNLGQDDKYKDIKLWTKFFIDPDGLEESEMAENQEVKKAKEEFDKLKQDEYEQDLAFRRQMFLWAQKDGLEGAKEDGRKEAQVEIAKKLLENNVDIEIISESTGLSKDDIEKLK